MRTTRRVGTMIAGLVASAVAATLLLAGCSGGGGATAPPGPPDTTVKETPAATASAGATQTSSVHAGNVPADTYTAVIAAIRKSGIKVENPTSVRVTYGADKEHVTANGSFLVPPSKKTPNAPMTSAGTVSLLLKDGAWQVVNVQ